MLRLESRELSKCYAESDFCLHKISFGMEKGEIIGLMGRSGNGKSTLLRLLNGMEKADSGEVFLDGTPLSSLKGDALLLRRRSVAYIFQDSNLIPHKSVFYHLSLPDLLLRRKVRTERIASLMEEAGLSNRGKSPARSLSGGEKQRVAILMALLQDPKVLLADEITASLDEENEKRILALLRKECKEKGMSLLMTSHNTELLREFTDRLLLLEGGRLL